MAAERRTNQEKLSPKDHMSRFLNGIRTFSETDYGDDTETRNDQIQAIVKDAVHIVNAHWWQRGRLRRQLNRETKTEPMLKKQADRILQIGIEEHVKEALRRNSEFYEQASKHWQKRIMTTFGISETESVKKIGIEEAKQNTSVAGSDGEAADKKEKSNDKTTKTKAQLAEAA